MDRFTDEQTGRAVDQAIEEQLTPFEKYGPVIQVFLLGPQMGPFAVAHGLGCIPDGFLTILGNGYCRGWDIDKWTDQVAYIRNDVIDTTARLCFVKLRKEIVNGNG